jgi:hypothetical protein
MPTPLSTTAFGGRNFRSDLMGAFGENFTTEGLLRPLHIGDTLQIGSARFVVTQPRLPCLTGIRLGRADIGSRRAKGVLYFAVLEEGTVTAGDLIQLFDKVCRRLPWRISPVYYRNRRIGTIAPASQLSALPLSLRNEFPVATTRWGKQRLERRRNSGSRTARNNASPMIGLACRIFHTYEGSTVLAFSGSRCE